MRNMDPAKRRWIVLVASCIANIFMGITYCWSIFQGGLMAEQEKIFNTTTIAASTFALAFTLNTGVGPIPMIAGGALQRKLGPGLVVTIGGLLTLIGMVFTSFATQVSWVWIGFGIIAGLGVGGAYGVTINNTVKFFPDKRGLIAGLSTCFFGLGSIIFPPILNSMIGSIGVMKTFRILGIIIGAVVMIAGFFISECPADWLPEGFTPPAPAPGSGPANKKWHEMLRDLRFWVAVLAFLLFASAGLFVVSQAKQMAIGIGGIDETASLAALTVSIIGIANSGGRLLWGTISDKIGRYPALMCMAAIIAIAGFGMSIVSGYAGFIICAILIACCYGGSMGVYPALTADNFGPKYNGINYGVMFCGFAAGGYVGPKIFTSIKESSGSYTLPLRVVAIFGIVALILVFILVQMRKSAAKKASTR